MANERIRVAIAEDNDIIREKYSVLISLEEDLEFVGGAKSYNEIVSVAESQHPDIILMDVEMDTNDAGIRATQYISQKHPAIGIIMLTVHDERENISLALKAGARSYVLKSNSGMEIIRAIKQTYMDSPYMSPEVMKTMISEFLGIDKERQSILYAINNISNLTKTELSILILIHEGKTQKEICSIRCVEMSTIKSHTQNILRKFGKSRIKQVVEELDELHLFDYLKSLEIE